MYCNDWTMVSSRCCAVVWCTVSLEHWRLSVIFSLHGALFDKHVVLYIFTCLIARHQVIQLDPKGQVVRCFGNQRGGEIGQLNIASYLALGSNGDVYVADMGNRRIIVLDSQLQLKRVVATETSGAPHRLCYVKGVDGTCSRLYSDSNQFVRVLVVEWLLVIFEGLAIVL